MSHSGEAAKGDGKNMGFEDTPARDFTPGSLLTSGVILVGRAGGVLLNSLRLSFFTFELQPITPVLAIIITPPGICSG